MIQKPCLIILQNYLWCLLELGVIKLTTAYYCPPNGLNIDRMPGKSAWGIDADDGYFVPVTMSQQEQLQKRFQLAPTSNPIASHMGSITANTLRDQFSDPQLAAALETLQSRLQSGEFRAVGKSRVALEDYLKRMEVQRRQAQVLERLKKLDVIVGKLETDA